MSQLSDIRAREAADAHYHDAIARGVERGAAADEAERIYRQERMAALLDYYGARDPHDV